MIRPADTTIVGTVTRRSPVSRSTHTTITITGNIPPGFSCHSTMAAAQPSDHAANSAGGTRTPAASSAHGTSPSRAGAIVPARNEPSSPKMASSAQPTAAMASTSVVDRRCPESARSTVLTGSRYASAVAAVTGPQDGLQPVHGPVANRSASDVQPASPADDLQHADRTGEIHRPPSTTRALVHGALHGRRRRARHAGVRRARGRGVRGPGIRERASE